MKADAFERWWKRFCRSIEGDEPYETARRLRRKLRRVRRDERPAFLDRLFHAALQRRHLYGVVLLMLDGLSERSALDDLARHLQPFPGLLSDDDESYLSDLMRVLAAADDEKLLSAVESYLLDRPIGAYWSSVPWALWPHRPRTFARAWHRFLSETPAVEWQNRPLVKAFLTEPEAIEALRRELERAPGPAWEKLREALLRQAGQTGWLSDEQRRALEDALA